MEGELPLPAPEHSLGALLVLLIEAEFDEFLTGGEYRALAISSPEIHCQLFVRPPWQPTFAALEVEPAGAE
jgi:hypothetical protein